MNPSALPASDTPPAEPTLPPVAEIHTSAPATESALYRLGPDEKHFVRGYTKQEAKQIQTELLLPLHSLEDEEVPEGLLSTFPGIANGTIRGMVMNAYMREL